MTSSAASLLAQPRMWLKRREICLRSFIDGSRDRRICGMSLEPFTASPYAESHGAVETVSAPYGTLEVVFGPEMFTQDDVLLDAGCGLGRPIAYLLDSGFPGRLVGAELNPVVAAQTQKWAKERDNVRIVCADVFELDIRPYTKFFMWYSMDADVLARFVAKIEREAEHPVRFFYVGNAGQSVFASRARWKLSRAGWVYRVRGMLQHGVPTRYGIWDFDLAES